MKTPTKESAENLNHALRGEISAIETYKQVLEKLDPSPEANTLRTFLSEHKDARQQLERNVKVRGVQAHDDSGVWGGVAKAVVGTAKFFGNKAALKALKEGEERGLKDYEEIVENENVSKNVRDMVRKNFIPNQRKHVQTLDGYIQRAS